MHRLLFRPTLFALALSAAACGDAAKNAVAPNAARPSFSMFNPEAPVPVPVSAVRSGDYVTITFMDDAVDETIVSAYFSGGANFAVTQNIVGTRTTGQRSAVVAVPSGYLDVQLRYLWNSTPEIQDSQTWGPFSTKIAITDGGTVTGTTSKGKGNRK